MNTFGISSQDEPILKLREDRALLDHLAPPTKFTTNAFIAPFQEIVNTYGVPLYKEANPALLSMVTFPFLFGVMFGDIMHGTILFLFFSYVSWKKYEPSDPMASLYWARYLFLLMGFFSFFCGNMYNDFTSIPLQIWGPSCWKEDSRGELEQKCVYPVGIDPKWYMSTNELTYINGLKMKLSVIYGVLQMSAGVIFKASNSIFFGRKVELYFEFIPQITLLLALFGFMDFLIIYKWLQNWHGVGDPPSVI